MPVGVTFRERFSRLWWWVFMLTGCGVRVTIAAVFVLPHSITPGKVVGIMIGLVPYVVLFFAAPVIRVRAVVVAAVATVIGLDVYATVDAMRSMSSSTGGVGLLVQPLFTMVVVIPASLAVGLVVRRIRRGAGRLAR